MDGDTGGRRRGRRVVWVSAAACIALAVVASTLVFVVPRADADTEVHLTAAGDFGARAATATVLDKIADLDPDAHLARAGDGVVQLRQGARR